MTNEEKKAIENVKSFVYSILNGISAYDCKILLTLIENQSKEIEELKDKFSDEEIRNTVIKRYREVIEKDYISKDKIKAKIEEYKKLINECIMNDEEIFCKECTEKCSFNQTIDVLQSLLKEE